jgi:hypothetical protein
MYENFADDGNVDSAAFRITVSLVPTCAAHRAAAPATRSATTVLEAK